jgi:hypothetical protein
MIRIVGHAGDGRGKFADSTTPPFSVERVHPAIFFHFRPELSVSQALQICDNGNRRIAISQVMPRTRPMMMVDDVRFFAGPEDNMDRVVPHEGLKSGPGMTCCDQRLCLDIVQPHCDLRRPQNRKRQAVHVSPNIVIVMSGRLLPARESHEGHPIATLTTQVPNKANRFATRSTTVI